MSSDVIRIQPTRDRRRAFAVWAVAQTPKLRTVGIDVFAVPAHLFATAPEEILIGALVDGHRYVSPEEEAEAGRPAPGARLLACGLCFEEDGQEVHPHPECTVGAPELLGVATPEGFNAPLPELTAVPGDVLPEVPESAYGPDSVALDPAEGEDQDAAADPASSSAGGDEGDGASLWCSLCSRQFTTARGRDSHRRQIHPEA